MGLTVAKPYAACCVLEALRSCWTVDGMSSSAHTSWSPCSGDLILPTQQQHCGTSRGCLIIKDVGYLWLLLVAMPTMFWKLMQHHSRAPACCSHVALMQATSCTHAYAVLISQCYVDMLHGLRRLISHAWAMCMSSMQSCSLSRLQVLLALPPNLPSRSQQAPLGCDSRVITAWQSSAINHLVTPSSATCRLCRVSAAAAASCQGGASARSGAVVTAGLAAFGCPTLPGGQEGRPQGTRVRGNTHRQAGAHPLPRLLCQPAGTWVLGCVRGYESVCERVALARLVQSLQ